jgi:CheY-like chemotaxis protein
MTAKADGQSRRILVVDDNADIRSSTKQLLEKLGYDVQTASEGAAAVRAHRERNVAIVLTDIFMAGTEGMETIATFKREWPDVRVVAMSGGGERAKMDYLEAAAQVGADATLQKPFTLKALLAAIDGAGKP